MHATKCFIDGAELSTLVGRNLPQRVHLCALTCASLNLVILKICKVRSKMEQACSEESMYTMARGNVSIPQQKEYKEPPLNKTMFELRQ